jgi:hypothetical protein
MVLKYGSSCEVDGIHEIEFDKQVHMYPYHLIFTRCEYSTDNGKVSEFVIKKDFEIEFNRCSHSESVNSLDDE